jgi:hypothetical protein
MKKKRAKYKKGEIGKTGPMLKNFLPPPDKLVLRESNVADTLSLGGRSVEFFTSKKTKRHFPN